MTLKGYDPRYYKRLLFYYVFRRVQSPACTIYSDPYLIEKMVMKTPRSRIVKICKCPDQNVTQSHLIVTFKHEKEFMSSIST